VRAHVIFGSTLHDEPGEGVSYWSLNSRRRRHVCPSRAPFPPPVSAHLPRHPSPFHQPPPLRATVIRAYPFTLPTLPVPSTPSNLRSAPIRRPTKQGPRQPERTPPLRHIYHTTRPKITHGRKVGFGGPGSCQRSGHDARQLWGSASTILVAPCVLPPSQRRLSPRKKVRIRSYGHEVRIDSAEETFGILPGDKFGVWFKG